MPQATAVQPTQNLLGTEKIPQLILKFSIPAIISMLVNAVYNMVDQIFIGQGIGMLGIAATNVALPITTVCTAAALLLGIGGASNFNLKLGAQKPEDAGKTAGNMLSMLVIVGVGICAIVLLFTDPLLQLFGATPAVLPYAKPYTALIAPGIPFLVFATGACNLIRADNSPNYAMVCMLAGVIFNLIFDPIFLFVFNMGIEGIALATTLGQVLSCAIAVFYILRRFRTVPLKRSYFRVQGSFVKTICALGMASCFNQLSMTVVQIVMNNVLRHYGGLSSYGSDIPLAAVGAITKLNILFLSFTIGIAQGCQPINSFNYGAKNYGRVKQSLKTAIIAASIISALAFLCFQLFPRQLMAIFGEDDALYLQFSVRYLRVFMMMTFVNGLQPVTANFLTSIGQAKRGILISLTRQILFLLPLIVIFPLFLGLDGVMYAGPVADAAAAVVSLVLVVNEVRRMTAMQRGQKLEAED